VPVFGAGGQVVASLELALHDLGTELQPRMAALVIAARSLSRELAGARPATDSADDRPVADRETALLNGTS
jgi:hypothetical protein